MKVLSCGSNGNFQLGNGSNEDSNVLEPSRFLINGGLREDIDTVPKKISCGGNHTLILFDNGELFSTGDNTFGQCGVTLLKDQTHVKSFTRIPGSWKDVACGWEFSVLLNHNDEMFVCGLGLKGELGLGKEKTKTVLTRLDKMCSNRIVTIKASIHSVLCRDENGIFYGWGDSKKCQFITKATFWEPEIVDFPVVANDYSFTKDTVVILHSGGIATYGKLKFSTTETSDELKTMWSSLHYRKENSISSEGNNSHGQFFPLVEVPQPFSFETGSEHGIILIENKVYAWGWGEHGNCGSSNMPSHDQIVFQKLNPIYEGNPKLMACGCATTWIVIE